VQTEQAVVLVLGSEGQKWEQRGQNGEKLIFLSKFFFFFQDVRMEEWGKWIGRESKGDFWKMVVRKHMFKKRRRSFWCKICVILVSFGQNTAGIVEN
jgi:hypothetical protein